MWTVAAGYFQRVLCPDLLLGMTCMYRHSPRIVNASRMFCAKTLISLCGASVGRSLYHILMDSPVRQGHRNLGSETALIAC